MKGTFPLNFIWPEMLWLLIAVPLLVLAYLWLLGRRKKTAVRYANLALVKQAMGKAAGWKRHVPPLLMLLTEGEETNGGVLYSTQQRSTQQQRIMRMLCGGR